MTAVRLPCWPPGPRSAPGKLRPRARSPTTGPRTICCAATSVRPPACIALGCTDTGHTQENGAERRCQRPPTCLSRERGLDGVGEVVARGEGAIAYPAGGNLGCALGGGLPVWVRQVTAGLGSRDG